MISQDELEKKRQFIAGVMSEVSERLIDAFKMDAKESRYLIDELFRVLTTIAQKRMN